MCSAGIPAPVSWTEIEQESFRAFCLAAADAIDNGRRYDEQAQRATDLEVFFDLSKRLRVAQNPEAIYPILVGQAMDLIRAEKGMLFLLEPKGEGFKCVYMAGLPPEARGEAFPTSGSAFGKVTETGAPYRTVVTVDGDRVSSFSRRIKVPDDWQRSYRELRSKNLLAGNVDVVFLIITLSGVRTWLAKAGSTRLM